MAITLMATIEAKAQSAWLQKVKNKANEAIDNKLNKKDGETKKSKGFESPVQTSSDFVRGNRLIFEENFSAYPAGTSAKTFKTNGAAAVATVKDQSGKWLVLQNQSTYKLAKQLIYPKHFTVEFDVLATADQVKDISPMYFGFSTDNSAREYTSGEGAYVELQYYDGDAVVIGSSNPQKYTNTTFDLASAINQPMHVSISVNGEMMTVYINNTKLADTQMFTPTAAKNFYITAPFEYHNGSKVLVSNIKIYGFGA